METRPHYGNRTAPNRFGDLRMSNHERALAQRQMEEAMLLADLTVRAWNRVRIVFGNIGRVLKGAFIQKRDYVKNGVVHFD